jgi:uncharacterized membrane protein (DUF373 family)
VLFLSSYSPLFLILALKNVDREAWETPGRSFLAMLLDSFPPFALVLIAVVLVSSAWLYIFLRSAPSRIQRSKWDTTSVAKHKTGDSLNYIITYIIPFLGFSIDNFWDIAAVGILLIVVGVIYVNSNLLYVNPMLSLFGYRIFEVDAVRHEQGSGKRGPLPRPRGADATPAPGPRLVKETPQPQPDETPQPQPKPETAGQPSSEKTIIITKSSGSWRRGDAIRLQRVTGHTYLEYLEEEE